MTDRKPTPPASKPTWRECLEKGMTRAQAAAARGVTYSAARKWEALSAERFSTVECQKGRDGVKFEIVRKACQKHRVPLALVMSGARMRRAARARFDAMLEMSSAGNSSEDIAEFFCCDRSTVNYGIRRASGSTPLEAGAYSGQGRDDARQAGYGA